MSITVQKESVGTLKLVGSEVTGFAETNIFRCGEIGKSSFILLTEVTSNIACWDGWTKRVVYNDNTKLENGIILKERF